MSLYIYDWESTYFHLFMLRERAIIKKLSVLFLSFIILLSGCVKADIGMKMNSDGSGTAQITIEIEKDTLDMVGDSVIHELDEEFEDEFDIEELEDDTYKGIRATKSFDSITEVDTGEEEATGESPFDFKIDKSLFSKTYTFNGNVELMDLDFMSEMSGLTGNDMSLTFTLTLPSKPKKHNATQAKGNTLVWELDDNIDEDMYAESSSLNWFVYVLIGLVIVIIVGFFFLKRKQTTPTQEES